MADTALWGVNALGAAALGLVLLRHRVVRRRLDAPVKVAVDPDPQGPLAGPFLLGTVLGGLETAGFVRDPDAADPRVLHPPDGGSVSVAWTSTGGLLVEASRGTAEAALDGVLQGLLDHGLDVGVVAGRRIELRERDQRAVVVEVDGDAAGSPLRFAPGH